MTTIDSQQKLIKELQQKAFEVIAAAKYAEVITEDFYKLHSFAMDVKEFDDKTLPAYNALRLEVIAALAIQERMTKAHLDAIV